MIRRSLATLLAATALPVAAQGQGAEEFAALIARSEQRIESSLGEYRAFLQKTADERIALASQINALENQLVSLRAQQREAEQRAALQAIDLEDRAKQLAALDTQSQYSAGVLAEYLAKFEGRTHIAEDQAYLATLRDIRGRLEQAGNAPVQRIPIYFEAIEQGLARQEELVGGKRFAGRAITPQGGVKQGTIAIVGPVAYFHADDASATGILTFNSGTIEPGLSPLEPAAAAELAALLDTGQGSLPLDASLGKALALRTAKGTLVEHVRKGGWVGYAILILGALSVVVAAIKLVDLSLSRNRDPGDVGSIARDALQSDTGPARSRAAALGGPLGSMLATGIDFVRADTETLLEAMETVVLRHRPRLERFLPFLATTAAVAPLMGLLGTVVGMIKTFTLIEVFGTGDAKSLSSGISEALVTTELGLIVAIPALILHGIFTRIMRTRIGSMEQTAAEFSRHVALERGKA